MSFSRNSVRVASVLGLLCAFVLCQGQGCGGTPTITPFPIVGSPDSTLDGAWTRISVVEGQTSTSTLTLANGIPTMFVTSGGLTYTLDGSPHQDPAYPDDATYTYTGTGETGRSGSTFTMHITLAYAQPKKTPTSVTALLTYSGTIAAGDQSIAGNLTLTLSSQGYQDAVTAGTFTMTKQ